jgi:DNA transformation protein
MATSESTIVFLLDQLSRLDNVSVKKMFGEYCLYLEEKPVAFVCDDQLFIKPTTGGRELIENVEEDYPYPGARLYFLITADLWDDNEWLCQLIKITANELPQPKQKTKTLEQNKKPRNSRG